MSPITSVDGELYDLQSSAKMANFSQTGFSLVRQQIMIWAHIIYLQFHIKEGNAVFNLEN